MLNRLQNTFKIHRRTNGTEKSYTSIGLSRKSISCDTKLDRSGVEYSSVWSLPFES
jgi:hypothetical protein